MTQPDPDMTVVVTSAAPTTLFGDADPFAWAAACDGEVLRQREDRRTVRVEVDDETLIVKYHAGCGWPEIIKNLASGRLPVVDARAEVRALGRLAVAGVPVPEVLAWGVSGRDPARRRSFVITRALPTGGDLHSLARRWRGADDPTPADRRRLIRRVAELTRRLHAAGVNHRDLFLDHFLVSEASPDPERIFLVDLHRAQCRASVPGRWRAKDLASLAYSGRAAGLSRRDGLRFLRTYFRRPLREILYHEKDLLRRVEQRAQALWRKGLRLGLVP